MGLVSKILGLSPCGSDPRWAEARIRTMGRDMFLCTTVASFIYHVNRGTRNGQLDDWPLCGLPLSISRQWAPPATAIFSIGLGMSDRLNDFIIDRSLDFEKLSILIKLKIDKNRPLNQQDWPNNKIQRVLPLSLSPCCCLI